MMTVVNARRLTRMEAALNSEIGSAWRAMHGYRRQSHVNESGEWIRRWYGDQARAMRTVLASLLVVRRAARER